MFFFSKPIFIIKILKRFPVPHRQLFSIQPLSIRQTVISAYECSFSPKYLLYTNTILSMLLCGAADCVQQNVEKSLLKKDKPYNFKRTGCMMVYAGFAAPISHYWYIALDKLIKQGSIHAIVGKKLLADQLICSPFFTVYFFLMIGFLQGQTVKETKQEIIDKGLTVYMVDCIVWPPVQAVNFYLIPSHLRVIYIAVATFGWDIFLSYSKFKEMVKRDDLS